ncbi:hypothetical protein DES49_2655 [Halospina denitrificans]|uniref:Uncharacterized protein n=1 Tax=Halospina denitrificans TaxID=332522 RepID=A0A4V6Q2I0_9GAMM|nr:hypothetical protein [Halospina denitrificans]TDT37698.1 hypothetical protein DES49_2655 [Halospina denitrificans]
MKMPSLSTTLKGNATFSVLCAAVLALFAGPIAIIVGVFAWLEWHGTRALATNQL